MDGKKIFKSKNIDPNVLRLLDANLNRAREGLRVLEDTARFVWNNKKFFEELRTSRHLLDSLTRGFYPELLKSRNSQQDNGRQIKEANRDNFKSVAAANFRRCEESLRVLEEYGKILSANAAGQFKKIRFRIYDLEKVVMRSFYKN